MDSYGYFLAQVSLLNYGNAVHEGSFVMSFIPEQTQSQNGTFTMPLSNALRSILGVMQNRALLI